MEIFADPDVFVFTFSGLPLYFTLLEPEARALIDLFAVTLIFEDPEEIASSISTINSYPFRLDEPEDVASNFLAEPTNFILHEPETVLVTDVAIIVKSKLREPDERILK